MSSGNAGARINWMLSGLIRPDVLSYLP